LKEVNLKEKPEEFVKLYSSISPIESASAKVPIWEGESNLIESSIIAEYIAERHPAVGLVPSNADEKAIMRLCVDTYEKTLGSLLIKCLKVSMIDGEDGEFSSAKTSLEKEIGDSLIALNIFLTRFGTSNGGAFLFGDRFSLAEVLVAPFLQRLFPVAKHFAQIDVLEMASSMNLDRFQAWVSAILERPSVLVADVDEGALIESMGAMRERFKTTP
jgi:glutathione S-transferase